MVNARAAPSKILTSKHLTRRAFARFQMVKQLAQSLLLKLKGVDDLGDHLTTGAWLAAAAAALIALGSATAEASPITTLFSTGVDAFGVPLPDGSLDPHYTVSGGGGGPFAIGCPGCVGWVGNTGSSSWISPAASTFGGGGPFTYHTTFNLTGFNPATAVITGSLAIDDEGSIFLNGVDVFDSVPTGAAPWSFFQNFIISSGFIAGINTLDIFVPNNIDSADDGPTGLQLNLSGTAIPEPASIGLLVLALGVFGATRRRNSKSRQA